LVHVRILSRSAAGTSREQAAPGTKLLWEQGDDRTEEGQAGRHDLEYCQRDADNPMYGGTHPGVELQCPSDDEQRGVSIAIRYAIDLCCTHDGQNCCKEAKSESDNESGLDSSVES
jgi:hypothetical protein